MALVRRMMLLGQPPLGKTVEQTAERAIGVASVGAHAAVPHQATDPDAASPATATAPAAAAVEQAAAAPTMPAGTSAVIIAFVLLAAGGYAAYALPHGAPFQVTSATAAYGAVLVFAGAIERLLEPFSHWLPGRQARNTYEDTVASMMNGQPATSLSTVAHAKAQMERAVTNRGVILWGIATAVATVVSSLSGFYLLRMIASPTWAPTVPVWVDALVTGLVVGSGTKPVHDLITKAQAPKNPSSTDG